MKKLTLTLFVGLLTASLSCNAQGFLKRIGKQLEDKAKNTVEQTIGRKPNNSQKAESSNGNASIRQVISEKPEGTDYPEIDGLIYRVNMTDRYAAVRKVGDVLWHETDTVYIPDYITYNNRRYPVKEIDNQAFMGETFTKIRLPNTLEEIGHEAFRQTQNLKEITIPGRVKIIHAGAFAGCGATKVTLPYGLQAIEGTSFCGMDNLTEIVIPITVKEIQMRAFAECNNLVSVKLPAGLTKIDRWVFRYCKSLKSIHIPYKVSTIEDNAFEGCTSLAEVRLLSGLTQIKTSAFQGCKSLKEIEFPASLVSIHENAFAECGFVDITIPKTITDIHELAFRDCMNLKHVTIDVRYKDFQKLALIFNYSRRGYTLFDEKDIYNLKNFTFTE